LTSQTGGHTLQYCKRYFLGYIKKVTLAKHEEYSKEHDLVKINLPKPGSVLNFMNYNGSMRVPFIVFAEIESFNKAIGTCQPNPSEYYTNKYQKRIPSSFSYYIKCFDNNNYAQNPVVFTAENEDVDAAQRFVDTLEEDIKRIYIKFNIPKEMIFTEDDAKIYRAATTCHICDGEFSDDDDQVKVRDHCHLSGKFRGAAHNKCNLNYKLPKFYPVVFITYLDMTAICSLKNYTMRMVKRSTVYQLVKKSIYHLVKML